MASIFETMTTLHVEEFTGKVTVKKEHVAKTIFFRKGVPVYVDSNVRSETLGQLLLGRGKLTPEQYRTILEQMEKTGRRQGELLVELGYLSAFEVYEALGAQVVVKFENVFMLDGADVSVEKGEEHLAGVIETPIDFFRTYLNFFQDWITEAAPSKYPTDKALKINPRGQSYLAGRSLQGRELKIVRLLDGRKTTSQILDSQPGEESFVFAMIEALNTMNFIDFEDPLPQKFQRTRAEVTAEKVVETEEVSAPAARVVDLTEPAAPKHSSPLYKLALQMDQPFPKLLRLHPQANRFQLKKSYEDLVREYHLDNISETYEGEEKQLADGILDRLTLAFTVLSDDKRRQEYLEGVERKEAQKEPSPKIKAEVALQKAHLFIARKKFDDAEVEIRKAIGLDPQEGSYHVDLAELSMTRATANKEPLPYSVENEILLALKLNSKNARAFFEMGVYHKLKNSPDKARTAFLKVLEIKPNDERASTELRLILKRMEGKKSDLSLRNLFKKKK